jgi:hypothetical protein
VVDPGWYAAGTADRMRDSSGARRLGAGRPGGPGRAGPGAAAEVGDPPLLHRLQRPGLDVHRPRPELSDQVRRLATATWAAMRPSGAGCTAAASGRPRAAALVACAGVHPARPAAPGAARDAVYRALRRRGGGRAGRPGGRRPGHRRGGHGDRARRAERMAGLVEDDGFRATARLGGLSAGCGRLVEDLWAARPGHGRRRPLAVRAAPRSSTASAARGERRPGRPPRGPQLTAVTGPRPRSHPRAAAASGGSSSGQWIVALPGTGTTSRRCLPGLTSGPHRGHCIVRYSHQGDVVATTETTVAAIGPHPFGARVHWERFRR